MTIVRAGALAACAAVGALTIVPLNSQSRPAVRERVGAAGAAIVLGLPPASTLERPDTAGMTVTLPSVWVEDPATGAMYRRDHVLVRFRESASAGLRTTALAVAGASRTPERLWDGWERAAVGDEATVESVRARLANDPAVSEVTFDYRVARVRDAPERRVLQPAVELRGDRPASHLGHQRRCVRPDRGRRHRHGAERQRRHLHLWHPGLGTIALRFAEAADLVSPGRIVGARDFVYGDDLPLDLEGHGTHVAGTIAQLTDNSTGVAGIAHKVRVMPVKVLVGADR